jgi:hypothetical protein
MEMHAKQSAYLRRKEATVRAEWATAAGVYSTRHGGLFDDDTDAAVDRLVNLLGP